MGFVIALAAISVGFTAKNVISYPTECINEEVVKDFVSPIEFVLNHSIS